MDDNGRDDKGRWVAGAKNPRKVYSTRARVNLSQWKEAWRAAHTLEEMLKIKDNLWNLALHAEDERVRLGASIHILDRLMGRPADHVHITEGLQAVSIRQDLNKEQVQRLEETLTIIRNPKPVDGGK